jgi:hypothetical protein
MGRWTGSFDIGALCCDEPTAYVVAIAGVLVEGSGLFVRNGA